MIADSERREVACKLRALELGVIGTLIPTGELAENILRAIGYGYSGAMTPYGCLADLIEPGEPRVRCVAEVKVDGERLKQLVHDAAVELTGVDRDALLALADEMEESGRHYGEQIENAVTSDIIDDAPGEFRDYARRIRAALGVE